jgi:hypothetical protein
MFLSLVADVGGFHGDLYDHVHRNPLRSSRLSSSPLYVFHLFTHLLVACISLADVGGYHGGLHDRVHRNPLHLSRTHPSGLAAMSHGDDEDEVQQGLLMMPEIDELEQQQHEALSNDEAHDQLMELPYGGELTGAVVTGVRIQSYSSWGNTAEACLS